MKRVYKVLVEPAEEGGYVVSVPALPGCVSQGDTFEEALSNIREAILLYLETLREEGVPVPDETHLLVEVAVDVPETSPAEGP